MDEILVPLVEEPQQKVMLFRKMDRTDPYPLGKNIGHALHVCNLTCNATAKEFQKMALFT